MDSDQITAWDTVATEVGASRKPASKTDKVLKLLKRSQGASSAELMKATGWQAHSVRGFLSGTIRKRMGISLIAAKDAKGATRYRIAGEQV
ncbi:hypothetical protein FHS85_001476 [Rhodoligotrophos appendicifer]|uniref:DUF3489 domain-containing protein n=1 Tax=Rhodoligotrophos appendicifer TaxID=987056 RepID=UPI00118582E6|nr:DUF3489 domain-containing protein [Rhodoligotrophos appendicifer]